MNDRSLKEICEIDLNGFKQILTKKAILWTLSIGPLFMITIILLMLPFIEVGIDLSDPQKANEALLGLILSILIGPVFIILLSIFMLVALPFIWFFQLSTVQSGIGTLFTGLIAILIIWLIIVFPLAAAILTIIVLLAFIAWRVS